MNKEREDKILKTIGATVTDLLEEQRPGLFDAYGRAQVEALEQDKNFSFNISIKAAIAPEGANHNVKTDVSWVVKHTVRAEQVVTDQPELFDGDGKEENDGREDD